MLVGSYDKPHKHDVYNIGSGGQGASINDIIDNIKLCTREDIKVNASPIPPTFVHKSILNIDRFEKEFGIKPNIGLREGVLRTWEYVHKVR